MASPIRAVAAGSASAGRSGRVLTVILAAGLLAACNVPRSFEGVRPPAVTVQAGESLLDISRRYDVSMTELIALNGIQAPYQVQPGQSLSLPQAGGFAGNVPSSLPATVAAAPGATPPAALPPLPPPSGQIGAAPPVGGQQPATIPALPPAASAPASIIPGAAAPGASPGAVQVEPLPPPTGASSGTAAAGASTASSTPTSASPPAAPGASASGLSWPLTGTTLVGYNAPLAGRANQGINIAAPAGTAVRSAGAGTVAYAGNELRGYGNLVLIRHANNLVTAYAHLADINVSKDQTVSAGQVIGTVGQTGNVEQPQLHFEVREGSTPVDPARHLP